MRDEERKYLVAVLLSALLFPGAGHIYLKKTLRGVLLCIATAALILFLIADFTLTYQRSVQSIPISDSLIIQNILALNETWMLLKNQIIYTAVALIIIWVFGIVDVLRSWKRGQKK